ncbi:MAG TPA: ATP-binding protein [Aquabacterium sp.]|nr:ATP-binding protein [Aquabacterium sp.]
MDELNPSPSPVSTRAALPRVLLVDDAAVNLMALNKALADLCDIQVATRGEQALRLAMADPPDMILLDVMMPDMDGYEVCRRLRANAATRQIPVAFLTALNDVASERQGLELGAVDYLTKPLNADLARLRVQNHLERERLRREVVQHRNELEERVQQRALSLSIAKEAAEKAMHLKDAILRNLNHELKTPLNGIVGMLALAQIYNTDPKVAHYLNNAEASAQRLQRTQTALLDLAEMEANRMTLESEPFRVRDLLNRVLLECRPWAHLKGLRLDIEAQDLLPTALYLGDPNRLVQVLRELLCNGVKFSEQGCVTVGARVESLDEGHEKLFFEVSDQGIGIAPEDQTRIFEAFEQLDPSMTRKFEGNGIGLVLSRKLARLMGGDVTVRSVLGRGSTFTLNVNVERVGEGGPAG